MSAAQPQMQQFYDMLLESQFWPQQQMVDYQRAQLEQLLRHARANVPLYEDRLAPVFRPDGSIDWDRWCQLPILKRSDLLEQRAAMQARVLPAGHAAIPTKASSGSTGAAVNVGQTSISAQHAQATAYRSLRWHGVDWSKPLLFWFGDDPNAARWPDGADRGRWGPPWDAAAQEGRQYFLNRYASGEQALEFIARNRIAYLRGSPKVVQSLALLAIRLGAKIRLDGAMGYTTAILEDEREDCRRAFGCEMFGPYSSTEGQFMAYQCPSGPHLHVNAETTLVEILREDGTPCAVGEMGRVVVTPLFNFAQPLIRYDQEDLAVPGAPCSCGRTLPVIEKIVGRVVHLFRFPDGKVVAPHVPQALRHRLGAQVWQFAQIGPLEVEVRYVPEDPDVEGDEGVIIQALRERVHPDLTVRFRRVDELHRPHGTKFIEYVAEL